MMKRVFVFLLSLCLIFCFTACGSTTKPADPTQEPTVSEPETKPEAEPKAETEAESVSLAAGDSGAGPITLDLVVFTMAVPEGLEYRVYDWYYSQEDSRATISLGFNKTDSSDKVVMELNTGAMARSYEEAVETSIALKNLDTYSNGKYEMGAETTYGPFTYQAYHTSTEYSDDDYLVSFLDFGEGMMVEFEDQYASGLISDPLFTEMLTSITLK